MDELIPTINTDTSMFTDVQGSTTAPITQMPDLGISGVMPQPVDHGAEMKSFIDGLRYNASMSLQSLGGGKKSDWRTKGDPNAGMIQTSRVVPLEETHKLMGDGETWIPKHESYQYGVDNDTRLSNLQSGTEKFFNPLKRFALNTVVGGTLDLVGSVGGIVNSAIQGRLDAMYDNDFSQWVDIMTEQNNLEYKNYYNEAERNQSLGMNIQSWDKVLGGAEFTARMLMGEALITAGALAAVPFTSGASLSLVGARIGVRAASLMSKSAKAANAIAKGANAAEVMSKGNAIEKIVSKMLVPSMMKAGKGDDVAVALNKMYNLDGASDKILQGARNFNETQKWLKRGNQLRFATMSPMYEAGFEARHFQNDATKEFFDYHTNELGRDPTTEEIQEFSKKMNGAAQTVFGLNMGILSVSNLALMGDLVGIPNPLSKFIKPSGKWFDQKILRIGVTKSEEGLKKAMEYGIGNRVAGVVTPLTTGFFTEGVYEEGTQGIASNTMKNYIRSSYDPQAMKDTQNYVTSFTKAFADQYTTQTGLEEVIIGGLIGGLIGGIGGASQNSQRRKQQGRIADIENQGDKFAADIMKDGYRSEWIRALFTHGNRFSSIRERMEQAETNGDLLGQARGHRETFISLLQAYNSVGKEGEFVKMIQASLKGLDANKLSETTGIELDQIQNFKDTSAQELADVAEKYNTVYKAGMGMFKSNVAGAGVVFKDSEGNDVQGNAHNYAAAMAYSTAMADFNQNIAADSWSAFLNRLGSQISDETITENITALAAIRGAGKRYFDQWATSSKAYTDNEAEIQRVQEELIKIDGSSDKEGLVATRIEKAIELTKLQARKAELKSVSDTLFRSMTEGFYKKIGKENYGTVVQLEEYDTAVQKINKALEQLPHLEQGVLRGILNVHLEANKSYHSFAKMSESLMNPAVKFKGFKDWNAILGMGGNLGKALAKRQGKFVSEDVKNALANIARGASAINISERGREEYNKLVEYSKGSPVTQEVIDAEPTSDILQYMKNKIDTGDSLTTLEKQFYDKYKDLVDNYTQTESEDPLNEEVAPINEDILKRRQALVKLRALNKKRYTAEQQAQIDEFERQRNEILKDIDALKQEEYLLEATPAEDIEEVSKIDFKINAHEREIARLEVELEENLRTLGFEVRNDGTPEAGVYYYGERISEEVTDTDTIIENYIKDNNAIVVTRPEDKTDYKVYTYLKKGIKYYGSLVELSQNENLPPTLREAIQNHLETGEPLVITNPTVRKLFTELTEDDVEVNATKAKKRSNVKVKTKNEKGKIVVDNLTIPENRLNFEQSIALDDDGNLQLDNDGNIMFNEDSVFEYEDGRLVVHLERKGRGKAKTTITKVSDFTADKILFETLYIIANERATKEQKRRIVEQAEVRKDRAGRIKELERERANRDFEIGNEQTRVNEERQRLEIEIGKKSNEEILINAAQRNYLDKETDKLKNEINKIDERLSVIERIKQLKEIIPELRKKLNLRNRTRYLNESSKEYKSFDDIPFGEQQGLDYFETNVWFDPVLAQQMFEIQNHFLREIEESGLFAIENGKIYFSDNAATRENQIAFLNYLNYGNGNSPFVQKGEMVGELDTVVINSETILNVFEFNFDSDQTAPELFNEENSEYLSDIRLLNTLEQELIDLETGDKAKFDPKASPEEKVMWMAENLEEVEIKTIDEAVKLEKPSIREYQRYKKLMRKQIKQRTPADLKEIADLREKLLQFETASNMPGVNLLELVELAQQEEEQIEILTNESSATDDEISEAIGSHIVQSSKHEKDNPAVSLVYDIVVVKMDSTKKRKISNKKPFGLLKRLMDEGHVMSYSVDGGPAVEIIPGNLGAVANALENNSFGRDAKIAPKDKIIVSIGTGSIAFTIQREMKGKDRGYYVPSDTFQNFLDAMNYRLVKFKDKAGYAMIMDEKSDGSFGPLMADKVIDNTLEDKIPVIDEINSISSGDEVVILYDDNDGINMRSDIAGGDITTKAMKGRFYIVSKKTGEFLGTLKGLSDHKLPPTKGTWADLFKLRLAILNARGQKLDVRVKMSFINFPMYKTNSDGTPQKIPLDRGKVREYGYVLDNKVYNFVGEPQDVDIDLFSKGLPSDGRKRPIVIFNAYGKKALVPITLEAEPIDVAPILRQVQDIYNDDKLADTTKALTINAILKTYGLNSIENNLRKNGHKLMPILESINKLKDVVNLSIEETYLNGNPTAPIDLNYPFTAAKLVVDTSKGTGVNPAGVDTGPVEVTEKLADDSKDATDC